MRRVRLFAFMFYVQDSLFLLLTPHLLRGRCATLGRATLIDAVTLAVALARTQTLLGAAGVLDATLALARLPLVGALGTLLRGTTASHGSLLF